MYPILLGKVRLRIYIETCLVGTGRNLLAENGLQVEPFPKRFHAFETSLNKNPEHSSNNVKP